MTVLVEERPAMPAAPPPPQPLRDRSSLAGWRLAARLARRETRRRPGRTVLAALLIALPVIAMTLGSVLVRTESASSAWSASWERRYPGADIAVESFADGGVPNPGVALPTDARSIEYLAVYTDVTAADPLIGRVWAMWTDAPIADPMLAGSIELLEGRFPSDGEVLLDPRVADELGVGAGDELALDRPSGTWAVAGIGRARDSYYLPLVLAPGFDRDRIVPESSYRTVLYDLPAGTSPDRVITAAALLGGATRFQDPGYTTDETAALAWGWVGGVLALVAVGIIVAAAFATSARRQLVAVGQLASNGATPQVVRRTLVLQGTWTAAVGAVGGVAIALLTLPFVRDLVQDWILDRDLGGYRIVPFDIAAIVVTALVAGTIAAAVPARSLSKVPVMAALAGRRPLGQPPKWLVPTGVALTLGGLGLLAVAGAGTRSAVDAGSGTDLFALVVIVGAVAVVFGMICATPLVIERAGRLAGRLPLSPRLALRGMARARTRSAAVVAAIAVAVAGAVAAGVVADAALVDAYEQNNGFLPDDTAVLFRYDDAVGAVSEDVEVDPPLATDVSLTGAERDSLDAILPGNELMPLRMAVYDPPAFRPADEVWWSGDGPYVATPELLDLIGLDDADRRVLTEEGRLALGYANQEVPDGERYVSETFPIDGEMLTIDAAYSSEAPEYQWGSGSLFVTEEYARELGFDVVDRGAIVQADEALTRDQMSLLDRNFAGGFATDAFVEPGDPDPADVVQPTTYWNVVYDGQYGYTDRGDLWLARAIIVGAAVLIISLVVAIGLSLAAAEGRDERDTLTIVGATPVTMRRQTATRAATMALTGIALGIPTGFVPTWVLANALDETGDGGPGFPWVVSAILVVAVPLVVAGTTWLATATAQRLRPAIIPHRD